MARTGFIVDKKDRIKAELGMMTVVERRGVADYIRYLNTLAARQATALTDQVTGTKTSVSERKTRTGAKRGRKPRTARVAAKDVSAASLAPSQAQDQGDGNNA